MFFNYRKNTSNVWLGNKSERKRHHFIVTQFLKAGKQHHLFRYVMFVFTTPLPQQVFCSAWWGCSLDVWQQLRVACFMLFICQHIMTGSSGFQQGRWVTDGSLYIFTALPYYTSFEMHFDVFQELEREITFQEGSGLYYYYYKHMLTAPSFERGTCTRRESFRHLQHQNGQ